jgi:hypothetical protein
MGLLMLGRQKYTQQQKYTLQKHLVPEPSAFEVELAIEKLKSHKSPGIDQIPAEWIKARLEKFSMRSINLFLFGIRRNCLRSGRSRLFYPSIRRVIVVIIGSYHFCQLHTKFYATSCCQGELHMQGNYW